MMLILLMLLLVLLVVANDANDAYDDCLPGDKGKATHILCNHILTTLHAKLSRSMTSALVLPPRLYMSFMASETPELDRIFNHSSTFLKRTCSFTFSISRFSFAATFAMARASSSSSYFLFTRRGSIFPLGIWLLM